MTNSELCKIRISEGKAICDTCGGMWASGEWCKAECPHDERYGQKANEFGPVVIGVGIILICSIWILTLAGTV